MRVVVTGASGGVGRALIPQLCARSEISHIVGIDRTASSFRDSKLSMHFCDMREASLRHLMEGADALIHLAFALTQGKGTAEEMHRNNVRGSLNVFQCARAVNIFRLVNLSSASVYGSGEQLEETAPLSPSPRFPYARQKAEIEMLLASEFSDLDVVHLRSMFILGPRAVPFFKQMCTSRIYVIPRTPYPRIQVVHEDDVASAVIAALNPNVPAGVFNIAAPEVLTVPELIRNGRSLVLGIPLAAAEKLVGSPKEGRTRDVDSALEMLRASLTVSCLRARKILGWQPRHSAWEARAGCDQPA